MVYYLFFVKSLKYYIRIKKGALFDCSNCISKGFKFSQQKIMLSNFVSYPIFIFG